MLMKLLVLIIIVKITKKITSRCFDYKTKIIEATPADNNTLDTEVVVLFKYLSNFWISLDLPLINCEIELDLSWSKKCIISEICKTLEVPANPAGNPPTDRVLETLTFDATFQIKSTKLYVLVVTLSINDNIKFLENLKQGFKRAVSWNKYRSEITTQPKNNNLEYMIDSTFRNINRFLVLSFKNDANDPSRLSFDRYYMPLAEIKYFKCIN